MRAHTTSPHPRIPYGEADFRRIRLNRWLYVDKTRFVRRLEDERYVFFIRPRRFGKTCWLSLLENYYDRRWAGEFETVFSGTDLGSEPTAERHRYVVLRFNFSAVNDALPRLERSFETYCHIELRGALERHPDLFPQASQQRILAPDGITDKLAELFHFAGEHGVPLYVLIDEYDNFANTLHCFGLLSIREVVHGVPRLAIPNQTVKRLMYGYLREAYEDAGAFDVNLYEFEQRMNRMANAGEWRPVFEFLAEAIAAQTGIRDYIAGEKVLEPRAGALGFLAAYLSVTDYFVFRSEAELGKGHADIALEPLLARFPHLERGYLIELKYLRRGETAGEGRIGAAAAEASAQLRRYLADERLSRQYPAVRFMGLALVFHGWEMVCCDAVAPG